MQSVNITRRVGKNLRKLSRIPPFRFQAQGQKEKRNIGGKSFTTCFTISWAFLTLNKAPRKLFEYACLLRIFVKVYFNFEKVSHYPYLLKLKQQKLHGDKCKKEVLLYSNTECKSVSKHQCLISKYHYISRQKFDETFHGFPVFVFGNRIKNENAELVEKFL